MRLQRTLPTLFLLTCAYLAAHGAEITRASPHAKVGERTTLVLKKSPPLSDAAQLKMRMHAIETPPDYNVSFERFDVIVPKKYRQGDPHGLFIWISPSNMPNIPAEWEDVLAEKKLIFVGAHNSGNNREVFARMRMAIDANDNLRDLYDIDPARVYVSGFSGGARVASMLGVTYADMFTGTIAFMGTNFYTDVVSTDKTEVFQMRYLPHHEILELAKTDGRFALVTGEKDFNLKNTSAVFEGGFKKEGFQAVKLFNIPGQAHQPPKAEWLQKALEFLDAGRAAQ